MPQHHREEASLASIIAMDYPLNNDKKTTTTRTETIFARPNNHRLRIILDHWRMVDRQMIMIQSPIRVNLERRTSSWTEDFRKDNDDGVKARDVTTFE